MWEFVSRVLKDPGRILVGMDALIDRKRAELRGNPEREAKAWLERLAEVDRERRGYLKLAATGRMSEEELDEALAELQETRRTAILSTIDPGPPGRVLSSLYPVVTIGLARVYLHERIERLQQIGIAICLSSVVAISGVAGGGFAEINRHEAEQQQVGAEERAQAVASISTSRHLSSEAVVSDGGEDQNAKSAASGQEMEDHR
jgi:hypothetical protein